MREGGTPTVPTVRAAAEVTRGARPEPMRPRSRHRLYTAFLYLVLLLATAFVVLPLLWFVSTSLKPLRAADAYPPRWIPDPVTLENYAFVLNDPRTWTYFGNTTYVGVASVAICLVASALCGYMAARAMFRGKDAILVGMLATSMVPGVAILPALYILSIRTGLYDTYFVLIIVFAAWKVPEIVWMLRNFFAALPVEIEEAALIDGASPFQVFWRILMPLSQPGLVAAATLVFIFVWNNWLISQSLTISDSLRLVTVGLYYNIQDIGIQWGRFTAYAMIAILPPTVLFLLLQTRLISGLTSGASKG
jgi:ABC-type glycerol-3-phosphate transport system permease component